MGTVLLWTVLLLFGGFAVLKVAYLCAAVTALSRTGGALFCATHSSKIAAVLDNLPMKPGQVVIDLGCGDGRFIAAASRRYSVSGVGYEVNLLAFFLACLRRLLTRGAFTVEKRDFWDVSLRDADVIFCYLFPDVMGRLALKAEDEMKDGALLVSCNFPLPGWVPERVIRADHDMENDPIFIYRKSASL